MFLYSSCGGTSYCDTVLKRRILSCSFNLLHHSISKYSEYEIIISETLVNKWKDCIFPTSKRNTGKCHRPVMGNFYTSSYIMCRQWFSIIVKNFRIQCWVMTISFQWGEYSCIQRLIFYLGGGMCGDRVNMITPLSFATSNTWMKNELFFSCTKVMLTG